MGDIHIRLKLEMNPAFPKEKIAITALNILPETTETAKLLNLIHNGTNTPIKITEAENIRQKVCVELRQFLANVNDYFNDELIAPLKEILRKEIVRQLHPDSPFTAFKIWMLKLTPKFNAEFGGYV